MTLRGRAILAVGLQIGPQARRDRSAGALGPLPEPGLEPEVPLERRRRALGLDPSRDRRPRPRLPRGRRPRRGSRGAASSAGLRQRGVIGLAPAHGGRPDRSDPDEYAKRVGLDARALSAHSRTFDPCSPLPPVCQAFVARTPNRSVDGGVVVPRETTRAGRSRHDRSKACHRGPSERGGGGEARHRTLRPHERTAGTFASA